MCAASPSYRTVLSESRSKSLGAGREVDDEAEEVEEEEEEEEELAVAGC